MELDLSSVDSDRRERRSTEDLSLDRREALSAEGLSMDRRDALVEV